MEAPFFDGFPEGPVGMGIIGLAESAKTAKMTRGGFWAFFALSARSIIPALYASLERVK